MSKTDILAHLRGRKEEALARLDDFIGPEMHMEELVARGIIDDIFTQAEQYVEWAIMPDGRPMFQHMLTGDEMIDLWVDKPRLMLHFAQIRETQGVEAAVAWLQRRQERYEQYLETGMGGKT